jgi:hypothetical protein
MHHAHQVLRRSTCTNVPLDEGGNRLIVTESSTGSLLVADWPEHL